MGLTSRALLRQAQDHRHECPGRLHPLGKARLDLRPGKRKPPRLCCITASGATDTFEPGSWIGDKGYIGKDMLTPIRKPAFRKLLDWEKEFNNQVNKIRYMIEQVIANFKTWRIMHTDYRRPLETFATTISTVIALHFYAA
jgi:hypothetical protein